MTFAKRKAASDRADRRAEAIREEYRLREVRRWFLDERDLPGGIFDDREDH
jgi:hypothetical protein